jgi:hypothetical protein
MTWVRQSLVNYLEQVSFAFLQEEQENTEENDPSWLTRIKKDRRKAAKTVTEMQINSQTMRVMIHSMWKSLKNTESFSTMTITASMMTMMRNKGQNKSSLNNSCKD